MASTVTQCCLRPFACSLNARGWRHACLNGASGLPQEYYSQILKKLKEVGAQGRQTDFYI